MRQRLSLLDQPEKGNDLEQQGVLSVHWDLPPAVVQTIKSSSHSLLSGAEMQGLEIEVWELLDHSFIHSSRIF